MTVEDELDRIIERLLGYYTDSEVTRWLCLPHPQLENKCPAELINRGNVAEVDKVIDRLDAEGYI